MLVPGVAVGALLTFLTAGLDGWPPAAVVVVGGATELTIVLAVITGVEIAVSYTEGDIPDGLIVVLLLVFRRSLRVEDPYRA